MRERRPKNLRSHGFSLGLLLMLLIASVGVNAQSRQIKGFVKDEAGKVLPGATITIKGTKKVTSADPNGMFSIDAEKGNSLEITFVGFVTQDIVVGDQTNLVVSLVPQFNSLNEVVVVGYGTQKKENLTGSVAVVNVQDAGKRVTNDVARALQGQVAGVQVNGSGVPGDGVSIRIRGVSSLNNNNPLYIIDGVQTQTPYDFPVGDIESIQVIKDGSAGAIYGFQGANGVILITTKKGKIGPVKINYNAYYGRQYNPKKLSVTDRTQYQQIADAAETNAGLSLAPGNDPSSPSYITNVNTDWQKANFTTGSTQNHELTFSGGNESTTYNLAFGYYNQSGTVTAGPNYRRYNMSGNLQGKKGILSYGAKMAFTEAYYKNLAYPRLHGTGNEVIDMVTAIPTMPVYDPSREGGYGGVDQNTQRAISLNVIGVNNLIQNNSQHDRFLGAAWVGLEFFKNFKYLLNVTFDRTDFRNFYFEPTYDLGWFYPSTSAYHSDGRGENYTALIENTLSYKFSVHKNNVELLAGTSYRRDAANTITGTATNLTQPYIYSFDNVSDQSNTALFGNSAERKFYSPIFGRLNYDYAGKYLLTANYRRDGSSQLRPENRYGNFAGASVGWILTKETIFHLPDAITNLKLRAGYGVQGNINSLSSWYPYQTIVNSNASYVFGNTLAAGTTQTQVFDQTNKWEQKKSTNIGLDLNMFHDRLAFTAEYYNNKINGILLAVPIPISVGAINTPTVNAASFTNKGLEFTVTYHSKNTGSFHYDISANASTLKNKVLSLGQGNNPIYGAFSKTAVGGEVGELFGYQTEGIFQNANDLKNHATQVGAGVGDVKFKDLNGDGIITDADRTYLGSAIPKLYYGFNFNVAYKNFDATLFIQGNYGSKIANGVYQALMTGQYGNQSTDELNYWTPSNTNTNVPRPIIGDPNGNGRNSDRYIQSGNFTRLQTAQIGYTIPTDLLNRTHVFKTFRVYLSGQNLATITGYKGYDPDFGNDGTLNRGFDYGSFPNPRTFLVGVQVGL